MRLPRSLGWAAATLARFHPAPAPWRDDAITDEWFRSHFHYAADVVHAKLAAYCDPASATLLDFGTYDAITPLALALRHGWRKVLAVDIDPGFHALPRLAREQIGLKRLPHNLRCRRIRPGAPLRALGPVDAVMSWSVFEHVDRPLLDGVVADLHATLKPGGVCFIQVDPLYYSPSGSHLGRFAVEPWSHLRMSHDDLRARVLSATPDLVPPDEITEQFRERSFDEYQRFIFRHYEELNRITADELVGLFERNGFALLEQVRHRTGQEVPAELLARHSREDLVTHEIIAVFRAGG